MNPRQQDFHGELDELELSTRVADALFAELAGGSYTEVKDRAWMTVVQCYRAVYVATGGNVPAEWTPVFDSKGLWHMPA